MLKRMNTTDQTFSNFTVDGTIEDIKQSSLAEIAILHANNSETCLTVLSERMTSKSVNCVASTDIDSNTKLFLYNYNTLMAVVYGNSGVYYRLGSLFLTFFKQLNVLRTSYWSV